MEQAGHGVWLPQHTLASDETRQTPRWRPHARISRAMMTTAGDNGRGRRVSAAVRRPQGACCRGDSHHRASRGPHPCKPDGLGRPARRCGQRSVSRARGPGPTRRCPPGRTLSEGRWRRWGRRGWVDSARKRRRLGAMWPGWRGGGSHSSDLGECGRTPPCGAVRGVGVRARAGPLARCCIYWQTR